MNVTRIFVAALPALFPAAAMAQDAIPVDGTIFDGDYLTIGVGAIYGASYDGSDDYVLSPIPIVQGNIQGIAITPRPAGLALDLIPDGERSKLGFSLGPVATLSSNRVSQIKDPVVRAAGKLKRAIEVGATAGVSVNQVLHRFDSLSLSADVKWDVNGAHSGQTISPTITYSTPLSRGALISVSLSARHVDDDYADYYYSVSPAQNVASGLPLYSAKGGWDSWSAGMLAGYDLNGNALDGGFALIALASYSRMLNDANRTPYTSIRGDADQWMVALGVGYTF